MSKLRDAAQQALEALEKEPADYADWIRTMKAARAALRTALAEQPAEQEPVAAQHRFRHPQKGTPDWSVWQPCKVAQRPAWEIDSQGYEVEYRALYAAPQPAIPQSWTPTAENINALPESLRLYIADLETNADPAGTVRDLTIARDTIRALEASNRMLRDAAPEAPKPAKQPLTREEIFELAEPFGEFKYGDAQGHKRIDFANAIIAAYERKNGVQT